MTDLSEALKRPGVMDAFEMCVWFAITAASQKGDALIVGAAQVGEAFAHLHDLVGGGPETYQPLKNLVHDAAAEAVRKVAGLPSPN